MKTIYQKLVDDHALMVAALNEVLKSDYLSFNRRSSNAEAGKIVLDTLAKLEIKDEKLCCENQDLEPNTTMEVWICQSCFKVFGELKPEPENLYV